MYLVDVGSGRLAKGRDRVDRRNALGEEYIYVYTYIYTYIQIHIYTYMYTYVYI